MKPVILFDVGTILVKLNFTNLLAPLKLSPEAFQNWKPYDEFERGHIDENAFITEVNRFTGMKLEPDSFAAWWNSILVGPVEGIPELLVDLSRETTLYGLTNTTVSHWNYLTKQYQWLSPIKEIFASFQLQSRKPEAAIYLKVCERLGIAPNEILFIDDSLANVQGARDVGMHAGHSSGSIHQTRDICKQFGFLKGL